MKSRKIASTLNQLVGLCWPTDMAKVGSTPEILPKIVLYPYGWRVYISSGKGNFPYKCSAQDKHPDAMIYEGDGSWFEEHDGNLAKCFVLEL